MKQATARLKSHRYEQGASLIIVVLLAMVVLAGLVVMSSNLALSSRRTTTEQKSILPAQFAAESGVAYAKAKLNAARDLMGVSSLPTGTNYGQIKTDIGALCPTATTLPVAGYVQSTATATTVPTTSIIVPQSALVCTIPSFSAAQAAFFAKYIDGGTVSGGTYSIYGLPTDLANRTQFFKDAFSYDTSVNFSGAQVKSGLQPIALLQVGQYRYKFFFKVSGLSSTGISGDSSRNVTVQGNSSVHVLDIQFNVNSTAPAMSSYGLFINRDAGYTYTKDQQWSGPVHTNGVMNFGYYTADSGIKQSIIMDGPFTSTGCTSIVYDTTNQVDKCNTGSGPTAYYKRTSIDSLLGVNSSGNLNSSAFSQIANTTLQDNSGTSGTYNNFSDGTMKISVADGNPAPAFSTPFINLPLNATSQQNLANASGIAVTGNIAQIILTDSTATDGYQHIDIASTNAQVSSPVRFRYKPSPSDPTKLLMEVATSGTNYVPARKAISSDTTTYLGWAAATGSDQGVFNGVIYSSGSIASLSGPIRPSTTASTATGGAAIADFANIDVVAANNITITGDIKYHTRCLTKTACINSSTGARTTDNMFGAYAGQGDIRIAWNPTTLAQNINPASNLNAPANLEVDGFLMAVGIKNPSTGAYTANTGSIHPWNTNANAAYTANITGSGANKGKFYIRGGTIKDQDAAFFSTTTGFVPQYLYDQRGLTYAPVGFPTTGTASATVDDTSPVSNYIVGLGKSDSTGTALSTSDFSLDNEIRQGTLN